MNIRLPKITTLSRRFMLGVVPVSLAGIMLLGVSAFYYTKRHITTSVNKEMAAFSKGAAASVSVFFRQRKNDIETLSETSLLADYYNNMDYGLTEEAGQYRRELERYFTSFSERTRVYNRLFFADANGRLICGVDHSKPMRPGGYAGAAGIVRQASAGRTTKVLMSPVTADPRYGPAIFYARPVFDDLKNLRGVIVLEASLRPVQYILASLRVGCHGSAYITDSANRLVLAWKDTYAAGPVTPADFTARESIPGTELRVMLTAPMSDFRAPLTSISRVTVFLVVFCGFLVWVFIYFTIRGLTRPVEKLVQATRSLAAGKEFKRVEISSRDEIGGLADSFNTMGAQLMERTRDLESRIKELLVLQGMSAAVIENLEEEHICRVCLEAAVSGLGFDRGILYLVDAEKKLIMGRYVHSTEGVGFNEEKMRGRAVPLDSGDILAEVIRTKKAVNVKDPSDAPGINRRFVEEVATKAFCLVPVMTEQKVLGVIGALISLMLFVCTGMIYACLRFLREWHTPLTVINYILLGSSSGFILAAFYAAFAAPAQTGFFVGWAIITTLLAFAGRGASLLRNARLKPKSTIQTAIGIKHPHIVQRSQGFMGGSFNTREFFHGRSAAFLRAIKPAFLLLAFVIPLTLLAFGASGSALLGVAFILQYIGLLAERWFFFAQANHPQNLYYQTIG